MPGRGSRKNTSFRRWFPGICSKNIDKSLYGDCLFLMSLVRNPPSSRFSAKFRALSLEGERESVCLEESSLLPTGCYPVRFFLLKRFLVFTHHS